MNRILVINTGSTSTKVAIFENYEKKAERVLEHSAAELSTFKSVYEQRDMRTKAVRTFIEEAGFFLSDITAIAARGGSYATFKAGAYEVDDNFVNMILSSKATPGAAGLSALIAADISKAAGIKAYIYDAVSVDEMDDVAKISGLPQIPRKAAAHTLNTKAVARELSKKMGRKYEELNFVIAHLGGGISTSAHCRGRIVDLTADDEGTFSPERPGKVPCSALVDLCFSGKYEYAEVKKMMRGRGGVMAYLNTNSLKDVQKMIEAGDKYAKLIYEAMAYQISKDIASMAAVLSFNVDRIILTGSIAKSEKFTALIISRVGKIAPVEVIAGSMEMEALAFGINRVINGEEKAERIG